MALKSAYISNLGFQLMSCKLLPVYGRTGRLKDAIQNAMQFKWLCRTKQSIVSMLHWNEGDFLGLQPRKISLVSGNFWGIRDGFPNYLQSLCGVRKMSVGHPLLIKPALRIYQETPPSRSISTDSVKVGSSLRECRMLMQRGTIYNIQGGFFNSPPPLKSSKYKKVNLG